MKVIYRSLLHEDRRFSSSIKNQEDYARVLLEITRKLLSNDDAIEENECKFPYLKLVIDKQARVYVFLSDAKFYSFAYGCQVEIEQQSSKVLSVYTKTGVKCTLENLSNALSVISSIKCDSIIDIYLSRDDEDIQNDDAYRLLEYFWSKEPGYIRYDYDIKNANGHKHPLNHFDVNISKIGQYKLGYKEKLTPQMFEDIINSDTDCHYLIVSSEVNV